MSLIQIFLIICFFSVGFSSWLVFDESINVIYDLGEGNTSNNDLSFSSDYVDLSVKKRINKNDLIKNVDTSKDNSNVVDKLRTDFSYSNKNSNAVYSGKLTDYFDVYDYNNPISDNSPYLYEQLTNNKIRLENHYATDTKITSFLDYQPTFDLIDSSKTVSKEICDENMNSIDYIIKPVYEVEAATNTYLFEPKIAYTAEYSDISDSSFLSDGTSTFSSKYTSIKIYCSRTKDSDGKYGHYRFHLFYYAKAGSESVLRRIDSGVYNTQITFTDGTYPKIKLKQDMDLSKYTSKTSSLYFQFYYETKSDTFSTSYITLYCNCGTSTSAGFDSRYEVVDKNRKPTDFDENTCQTELTKLIANTYKNQLSKSSYTSEWIDDSNANLSHEDMQYLKIYCSRLKYTSNSVTYTRDYYIYVFYYEPLSNELKVLVMGSYFANNNSTETDWPFIYIHSTTITGTGIYPSSLNSSKNGNSYLRVSMTRYKTGKTSYEKSQLTNYFGNRNYNDAIDTSVVFDNDLKNKAINYLKSLSEFKSGSTYTGELLVDESNIINCPNENYLFFVSSRRKDNNSSKYYYDKLNIVYFNKYSNSLKYAQFNNGYLGSSASSGTTMSDWDKYTINSYYIGNSNESDISILNITREGYNSSNTLIKNSPSNWYIGSSSYRTDYSNQENLDKFDKTVYSSRNNYYLYKNIDFNKEFDVDVYCEPASSTDSTVIYKAHYSYYREQEYNRYYSTINCIVNLSYMDSTWQGYLYSSSGTKITPDKYEYIGYDFEVKNQKNETKLVLDFKNKEDGEIYHFYFGVNVGTRTKGYFYKFIDNNKNEYLDYEYRIRLKAKNEDVKNNIVTILRCFNYSLDVSMERYDIYGNAK